MTQTPNEMEPGSIPEQIHKRKRIILGELKDRTLWFVRLRWWVPPSIVGGVAGAWFIGVKFAALPLLLVAAFILTYNVAFYLWSRSFREEPRDQTEYIQHFTYWQVGLDYVAMFLLIHFTGGASSPFIFFFIFHIIFASILLRPRSAYGFATLAAAGMCLIFLAEYLGWIPHHAVMFRDRAASLSQQPFHMIMSLGFFATSVFITAFSTTAIMTMLRRRILKLAELSEAITTLNSGLNALYAMTQAVLSTHRLEQVLNRVTSELAEVVGARGISVKLLSEDGKLLRYAAAYGLPTELTKDKTIDLQRSPLNRRIIEGEPFVTGRVTEREMFQFGEDLAAARLKSVLFVPLKVEGRVIGILGAYSELPEQFGGDEVDFFRLAAGLVAIALENARSYEEIQELLEERSWFMMRVAHNLRAPLAATISILDVVQGEYLGDLNDRQISYLRRIEYPIRNMLSMINELMVLYAQRKDKGRKVQKIVNTGMLITRIKQTFQGEAERKKLRFEVRVPDELPMLRGDEVMIEQMLENLVSNAIKYTPAGGYVKMSCACENKESIRIEVSDNGIGIPKTDTARVFEEFFRAQNAREVEQIGTGLGLAIVKEIINRHGGRLEVKTEEGLGTSFIVYLPISREEEKLNEHLHEKEQRNLQFHR